jgi:hypothetical protein
MLRGFQIGALTSIGTWYVIFSACASRAVGTFVDASAEAAAFAPDSVKSKDADARPPYPWDAAVNDGWEDLQGWNPDPDHVGCALRIARDPETQVIPQGYRPCNDGQACEVSTNPWTPNEGNRMIDPIEQAVRGPDGKIYVHNIRINLPPGFPLQNGTATETTSVVEELGGYVLHAEMTRSKAGGNTKCISGTAVTEAGIVREVWDEYLGYEEQDLQLQRFGARNFTRIARGSRQSLGGAGIGTWASPDTIYSRRSNGGNGPDTFALFPTAGGTPIFAHRASGAGANIVNVMGVGDVAVAYDLGRLTNTTVHADGSLLDVLPSTQASVPIGAALDRKDANRIYWGTREADGFALWSAPYANTPASLRPELLYRVHLTEEPPIVVALAVDSGYVLAAYCVGVEVGCRHLVVRARDKAVWKLLPEAGSALRAPTWIDDRVIYGTSAYIWNERVLLNTHFYRRRIADLGTPFAYGP